MSHAEFVSKSMRECPRWTVILNGLRLFEISRFLPLFLMMIPSTQMCKLIIGTKTLNVLATSPIRLDIDDVPMIGASSVNGFQPSKATQIYLDQQLLETINAFQQPFMFGKDLARSPPFEAAMDPDLKKFSTRSVVSFATKKTTAHPWQQNLEYPFDRFSGYHDFGSVQLVATDQLPSTYPRATEKAGNYTMIEFQAVSDFTSWHLRTSPRPTAPSVG
ncbi:hypothetical protein DFQ30_000605 [Apophysomyces sp. BC1015]|nr:hypothetical protein DFQ30_000605 [Apophysomyces sp. BC1015]